MGGSVPPTRIRFDVVTLRPERYEELVAWVRQLGVTAEDVRQRGVIVDNGSGYELHLSRFVRDEKGAKRLDLALDDVVSEPLVVDLGNVRSWPAWLESASDNMVL